MIIKEYDRDEVTVDLIDNRRLVSENFSYGCIEGCGLDPENFNIVVCSLSRDWKEHREGDLVVTNILTLTPFFVILEME